MWRRDRYITVGDTAIEDFLEHRLKNLAEEIIKPSSEDSSILSSPLSEVNDVDARVAGSEEAARDETIASVSNFEKDLKDYQAADSVDETGDNNA